MASQTNLTRNLCFQWLLPGRSRNLNLVSLCCVISWGTCGLSECWVASSSSLLLPSHYVVFTSFVFAGPKGKSWTLSPDPPLSPCLWPGKLPLIPWVLAELSLPISFTQRIILISTVSCASPHLCTLLVSLSCWSLFTSSKTSKDRIILFIIIFLTPGAVPSILIGSPKNTCWVNEHLVVQFFLDHHLCLCLLNFQILL